MTSLACIGTIDDDDSVAGGSEIMAEPFTGGIPTEVTLTGRESGASVVDGGEYNGGAGPIASTAAIKREPHSSQNRDESRLLFPQFLQLFIFRNGTQDLRRAGRI
jgi:hypothetical protein